jgi:hypothetical protein
MSENAIATTENTAALSVLSLGNAIALPQGKYSSNTEFDKMAAGSFLPYLQLAGSSSNLVKKGRETGVKQGEFVVCKGKDTLVANLGERFNCLPFAWRPKAIMFAGADTKSYYDPNSEAFREIERQSKAKNKSAKFGHEFLVWLPDQNMFAAFFFNNPTMRRVSPDLKALLPKNGATSIPATVYSKLIETADFSWYGPVVEICSTPLNMPAIGTPEADDFISKLKSESEKFANPPESEAEVVAEDEAATTAQRAR